MPERVSQTPYRFILILLLLVIIAACAPTSTLPSQQVFITQTPMVVAQLSTPDSSPLIRIGTATTVPESVAQVATPITRTPGPILIISPEPNQGTNATPITFNAATPNPFASPEPDAIVARSDGVILRSGPGISFEASQEVLVANTPLKIIAVSPDMVWYQVQTVSGQQGWTPFTVLTVYSALSDLPVVDIPIPSPQSLPDVIALPATEMPTLAATDIPPPVEEGPISNRVRQIFALGQEMGNNSRVFIKVGDSTTEQQAFMIGFGSGEYNLGSYTDLQASLDYFSPDAFTRDSLASESAFNSASVLDSFRVPEEGIDICQPGEKPLECEIRVMKPAFAFILFGGNEVRSFDMGLDVYSNQIQQLIDVTTTRGVIPILTTFPHAPDFHENATAYNEALRSIAADQQIPLIDLEAAVLPLPKGGVSDEDGFHMSMRGVRGDITDNWIMLNGEEKQYGATLRNLLTLQMLDMLRRELGLQ